MNTWQTSVDYMIVAPMKLSAKVALIYKRTNMLEKAIRVNVGFEESIHLIFVLETTRKGKFY